MKQLLEETIEALVRWTPRVDGVHIKNSLIEKLRAAIDAPEQKPYGWMIDGTSRVLRGEYAESETKAEAKRCGGTCKAFPLYTQPYDQQSLETCDVCGWKAIVPGEPCLMCERNAKMLEPEQKPVGGWECNECGSVEYTSNVSFADVHKLGCSQCGSSEWLNNAER